MLAMSGCFVYIYCLVDDAIKAGRAADQRRRSRSACKDAVNCSRSRARHLLGRQ